MLFGIGKFLCKRGKNKRCLRPEIEKKILENENNRTAAAHFCVFGLQHPPLTAPFPNIEEEGGEPLSHDRKVFPTA